MTKTRSLVPVLNDTTARRFWAKVDKTPDCWIWTGHCSKAGYGRLAVAKRRTELAHRISVLLDGRTLGEGDIVRHTCDNPPCVRPEHLLIGTTADNIGDMVRRGRQAKGDRTGLRRFPERYAGKFVGAVGERHGFAKRTEAEVRAIREAYDAGETVTQIVVRLGLPYASVHKIALRRAWRHVA